MLLEIAYPRLYGLVIFSCLKVFWLSCIDERLLIGPFLYRWCATDAAPLILAMLPPSRIVELSTVAVMTDDSWTLPPSSPIMTSGSSYT